MKILIAAGGSGGHIFPAIALAKELTREPANRVIFAASKRALDRKMLEREPFKKIYLSINPMPYRFDLRFARFMIKFLYDAVLSLIILIRERPDVSCGFGGYTSGAIMVISSLMGIKTIVHEQNLVPGRANRILDRFVDVTAVSFEESKKYFRVSHPVFTGNPLREAIITGRDRPASDLTVLPNKGFTLLIMGGSQGARSLNRVCLDAISLLDYHLKKEMNIIHITGPTDCREIDEAYKKTGLHARVFSFIDDIHDAYRAADLAISRSGAAAIFELAFYGKPMILIPYPFKKNNQRFNAEYFAKKGAAIYLDEKTLSKRALKDLIELLVNDKMRLSALSDGARRLACPDAAKRLSGEIIKLAGKR